MNLSPLPDRWASHDLPVLMEVARRLEAGDSLHEHDLVKACGLDHEDLMRALDALLDARYITGKAIQRNARRIPLRFVVGGLTERGRRTVGLWPSGDNVDALIDALQQAEEATEDPEERSALRRAWSSIGGVSRDVMVDVVAAVIARQSGMG